MNRKPKITAVPTAFIILSHYEVGSENIVLPLRNINIVATAVVFDFLNLLVNSLTIIFI